MSDSEGAGGTWVAAWGAAMSGPSPLPLPFTRPFADGFKHQTVRHVVRATLGGSAVRVRLSNLFGAARLQVDATCVGLSQRGPGLRPGSGRALSFGGEKSVRIAAGEEVTSDAVDVPVGAGDALTVSLFFEGASGAPTFGGAGGASFVAAGDLSDAEGEAGFAPTDDGLFPGSLVYFLTGVDVLASADVRGAVVALGDSITAGGWPGYLADRLLAAQQQRSLAVLNVGIGGNRILSSGMGESALERFDRDVLARPGARAVIFLEGTNDIGFDAMGFVGQANRLGAADLIAGHDQVIDRAHAAGLKVFGGTMAPFKGASYWTPEGETKRQAVNDWIRSSSRYDGVIDFAVALADPADPLALRPEYDSGDHLHPNEAGQRRLAEAVDLRLFDF